MAELDEFTGTHTTYDKKILEKITEDFETKRKEIDEFKLDEEKERTITAKEWTTKPIKDLTRRNGKELIGSSIWQKGITYRNMERIIVIVAILFSIVKLKRFQFYKLPVILIIETHYY
ncbi:558_t:CDS:2 [Ambispora gerdemannii]|uniref:558_t:CDS:1 n=1 Tax=Ambispora gerdemannii TaxID=144530 RepID=A0A9N9FKF1_9GLOM|nr:558_t:CDS:2 [Ambispora gerdemannii]